MEQAIKEAGKGGEIQNKDGWPCKVDEDGISLWSMNNGGLHVMTSKEALNDGWTVAKVVNMEDKIRGIIARLTGIEVEKVTNNATLVKDLGADSLDVAFCVIAFEDEFGIEIPDKHGEAWRTVGDVILYLKQVP